MDQMFCVNKDFYSICWFYLRDVDSKLVGESSWFGYANKLIELKPIACWFSISIGWLIWAASSL